MYFVSTSGGTVKGPDGDGFGQLWHYVPGDSRYQEGDQLVLVFESSANKTLESPDNICITPNGGILFCEDDAVGGTAERHAPARAGNRRRQPPDRPRPEGRAVRARGQRVQRQRVRRRVLQPRRRDPVRQHAGRRHRRQRHDSGDLGTVGARSALIL